VPGVHTNRGAKRAREARAQLGLDPAAPVACILTTTEQRAGVPVLVGALPEQVAGAVWRHDGRTLIWVNGRQAVVRQRFTVAHELGHVMCGHGRTALDTQAVLSGRTADALEVQANAFAAEFLAPRAGLARMLDGPPTLEDVVRIAARFGISAIAALYRCRTLGMVSGARADRLSDEIEAGLAEHVAVEPFEDALSRLEGAPRLPAAVAGSALAGVLRGDVSVEAAAMATGCEPATLRAAAAALSR
jgi:Zn-dependent peptidase ImmA (M78 family)